MDFHERKVAPRIIYLFVLDRNSDSVRDFSFYGGLYRDVNLIVGDRLSFDYLDGSRDGVYISAENIGDKNWEMRMQGTIVNADVAEDVSVYCILMDADEVVCEKSVELMVENREDFSLTHEKVTFAFSAHTVCFQIPLCFLLGLE